MGGLSLGLTVLTTAAIFAQSLAPTFDVASIKPSKSGGGPSIRVLPGRFLATYSSLRDLMAYAYGLRDDQIADGPSWIASDHYDVEATAVGNPPVGQIAGSMLQELLKDRFRLVLRKETRQLPVYELTVVKNGLKLQPTKEGSCTVFSPDSSPLPVAPDAPRLPFCGPRYGPKGADWTLDGSGIRMEALAESLSRVGLGRSVVDKTGLTGSYDVHLKWTADTLAAGTPDNQQGPSLFTSLREQLGLKLESAKGPVEVFAIDSAEKPAGN